MLQITGIVFSLIILLFQMSVSTAATLRDMAENPKIRTPEAVYQAYGSVSAFSDTDEEPLRGRFIVRLKESTDASSDFSLAMKASRVASQQAEVLQRLAGITESEIKGRFSYQNSLAVSVTAEQLSELLESEDVLSIEEDSLNQIATAQGIPLIKANTIRSSYTGQGISIAITDTGIDYTHPMLGGGAFPNSKVIGGYDTGQDDADPMDLHGHGTACAGIAAGSVPSFSSNYIGGVAPDAKLYALKITYSSSGGYAYDSDIIEAWEWCVTHQYDNVSYPIMIVSTSFGGGKYAGSCDASRTALAAAADTLKVAGIALFVSSGNDGYCDSVESPACLSSSIAVGAVYDASVGAYAFCVSDDSCLPANGSSSCSTGYKSVRQTTAAGLVTVYSNSGTMLDLFAPSHNATTLDTGGIYTSSFGGTSAATPYAAGAAALLQQVTKARTGSYLTVAALKQKLQTTGSSVSDSKAGLTRALIDLHEAVGSVIGSAPVVATGSVSSVSGNWAIVNGSVTSDGWTSILSKGVCVNTTGSPTLADSCFASGGGVGSFSTLVQGLALSSVYYARAFGTNRIGTRYGAQVAFTTSDTPTPVPGPAPTPTPGPSPTPPPAPPSYSALFFFHNELTGKVAYWQVDPSGELVSQEQGSGWDYVSDSMELSSDWRLNGSLEPGGVHTLFWQNTATGEVRYWKTTSEGVLRDRTEGSGWGQVAAGVSVPEGWLGAGFESVGGQPSIFWQHQPQGIVNYWRISTGGTLKNRTQDDGWGLVSGELRVNSAWRLVEILEIGGWKTLIWQHQGSGKVVYWRLGDDAKLKNRTQGDGWDYVADTLVVNSNWRLAGGASVGEVQTLFWQNHENGKVAYWRLSDGARLVNETRGDGWDFVADELVVPADWYLVGVAELGTGNSLIWQSQDRGLVAYWHLTDGARLKDRTPGSGWGLVSDTLRLAQDWRLGDIARK